MTFGNPFEENNAPAMEEPPAGSPASPVPTSSGVERASDLGSDEAVTLTLKEGAGFDAAWIVVKAPTVEGALTLLDDAKRHRLGERVKEAAEEFRSGSGGNSARQANTRPAPQQRQAPAQQYNAPQAAAQSAVPGDSCPHGRTHKEGVSKASGKPYSAYFCNGPRGQQCDPIWGKPPQAQQNGPIPF